MFLAVQLLKGRTSKAEGPTFVRTNVSSSNAKKITMKKICTIKTVQQFCVSP